MYANSSSSLQKSKIGAAVVGTLVVGAGVVGAAVVGVGVVGVLVVGVAVIGVEVVGDALAGASVAATVITGIASLSVTLLVAVIRAISSLAAPSSSIVNITLVRAVRSLSWTATFTLVHAEPMGPTDPLV